MRHGVGRSYLTDDVRTVSSIAVCSIDNSDAICVQKVQTKRERERGREREFSFTGNIYDFQLISPTMLQ